MKRWIQLLLTAALCLLAASSASAQGGIISGISWRYTPAGAFPAAGATVTICTTSATGTPCTPTVSLFSDSGLTMPVSNPLAQCTVSPQVGCIDNLGNFTAFATSGLYTYTITGVGLTPYGPIPIAAFNSGGSILGTVSAGQIPYGTAANTVGSSPNLTWNSVNNTWTVSNPTANGIGDVLINPTAATAILAQPSPIFELIGAGWNGAASYQNICTLQNVVANGTNAGQQVVLACQQANTLLSLPNTTVLGLNVTGLLTVGASGEALSSAAATSGGNQPSPPFIFNSAYWNGATSVLSSTTCQDLVGTGATPTTTTTCSNSGAFNWAGFNILGAPVKSTQNAIGTTPTDGFQLFNTTAAGAGAQQFSPSLHWEGQGWKTNAVAASQAVDIISYLKPVQGAANPFGQIFFASSINGSGYTSDIYFDTFGNLGVFSSIQNGATGQTVINFVAPTILAAGCGGLAASILTQNGTAAFKVGVGTGNGGTCTITMPAATTDWLCQATDITGTSANVFITKAVPTPGNLTTEITLQNYTDVAGAHAWVDSDVIEVTCHGE